MRHSPTSAPRTHGRAHEGRLKPCGNPKCNEPTHVLQPITVGGKTIEVCTACKARFSAILQGIRADRRNSGSSDVRQVMMSNGRNEKRYANECPSDGADSMLDAEPMP